MSGSDKQNAVGVYGVLGTASAANVPGARGGSVSWVDSAGDLWLFGGFGFATDSALSAAGELNDLWMFSPSSKQWTWVSGSNNVNASPVFGKQGVASASTTPGGLSSAAGWKDNEGNLWLFGGRDLWQFSLATKMWTWMGQVSGVYGTQGAGSIANGPKARANAASWTDASDNFWLFGGTNISGYLNDLWAFNPSTRTWTWMAGNDTPNATGVYGKLGVPSSSNTPGARAYSVSWVDKSGNLWLYGGAGYDASTKGRDLNDLWEFSPSTKQWAWVHGSSSGGMLPVYGMQGVAAVANTPGGRDSAVGWTDRSGNLWLFGGFDFDGPNDFLNDLWEFNPTTKQWAWRGGSNTGNARGVYGSLGTPSSRNIPGARGSKGVAIPGAIGSGVAVAWTDASGNFWLFGGNGFDSNGASDGLLNDLWRYQP